MEFYSLEDEEGNNMFLTQESKEIVPLIPNFEVETDMEVGNGGAAQKDNLCSNEYSDISDAEDFQIPCSQVQYASNGYR